LSKLEKAASYRGVFADADSDGGGDLYDQSHFVAGLRSRVAPVSSERPD
jgi:hypothetical protein